MISWVALDYMEDEPGGKAEGRLLPRLVEQLQIYMAEESVEMHKVV